MVRGLSISLYSAAALDHLNTVHPTAYVHECIYHRYVAKQRER